MQCRCCMWFLLVPPGRLHRTVMVSIAESSYSNSKRARQERACKATKAEAASPLLCSLFLSHYVLPSATSTHQCSAWGLVHGSTVQDECHWQVKASVCTLELPVPTQALPKLVGCAMATSCSGKPATWDIRDEQWVLLEMKAIGDRPIMLTATARPEYVQLKSD